MDFCREDIEMIASKQASFDAMFETWRIGCAGETVASCSGPRALHRGRRVCAEQCKTSTGAVFQTFMSVKPRGCWCLCRSRWISYCRAQAAFRTGSVLCSGQLPRGSPAIRRALRVGQFSDSTVPARSVLKNHTDSSLLCLDSIRTSAASISSMVQPVRSLWNSSTIRLATSL